MTRYFLLILISVLAIKTARAEVSAEEKARDLAAAYVGAARGLSKEEVKRLYVGPTMFCEDPAKWAAAAGLREDVGSMVGAAFPKQSCYACLFYSRDRSFDKYDVLLFVGWPDAKTVIKIEFPHSEGR